MIQNDDHCPVCLTGRLENKKIDGYLHCGNCASSIAINQQARQADEYQAIEWYGHRWEFDVVTNLLRNCKSIVEIGCGEGYFASSLDTKRNFQIYKGIDFSEAAISVARARINNETSQFLTSDLNPQQCDAVCMFHTLEHISDIENFLKMQIQRYNPSYFAISVPNPERLVVKTGQREAWDYPPHHLFRFTARGLQMLFIRLNYRPIFKATEPLRVTEFRTACSRLIGNNIFLKILGMFFSFIPNSLRPKQGQALLMIFKKM